MSIPKILGCPLWYGRIKNRVALKHIFIWKNRAFWKMMSNIGVGDLINDCSGYNVRIAAIEPYYRKYGKGYVLMDIDITNDKGGGCSFAHCGVEPGLPREEVMLRKELFHQACLEAGDTWDFAKRAEFTTVDEFGIATYDHKGFNTKYGKADHAALVAPEAGVKVT